MVKLSKFKEVVSGLVELHQKNEEYLQSVPSDLREGVFDNEYTNNQGRQFDLVFKALFGNTFVEEVYWFLYDWKPGYHIEINGKEYRINNIDDYFKYIEEEYSLED